MYSMVAFGLVVGFLMGGYFLRMHENSFGTGIIPHDIYPGHPRFIGGWWMGFVILGLALILIALPFFAFPKRLPKKRSKSKCQLDTTSTVHSLPPPPATLGDCKSQVNFTCDKSLNSSSCKLSSKDEPNLGVTQSTESSSEYGRNIKQIPQCMWRLISNPVYIVTCLGSCMELSIVSGFLTFLPKYLETQFTVGKSEANIAAGAIAVPGACIGIFLGGQLGGRLGIKGNLHSLESVLK